jgi:hypothetical protein
MTGFAIRKGRAGSVTLLLASALLLSCSKDTPVGSSTPSPTPHPTTPTPTPTPAPVTDPRITKSCARLGPGSKNCKCSLERPVYQDDVNAAILKLINERPDIFEGFNVVKVGAYYVGVLNNLDQQGICGYFDGDEILTKKEDGFSEHYDILSGTNTFRMGASNYTATCYPSCQSVPTDGQFVAAPLPGCNLPGSQNVACGKDPIARYQVDMEGTLDWVVKTYPSYFDFQNYNPGTGDPYVVNGPGVVQRVQEHLQGMGYCTKWDGEELALKKGTNEFSEHYDFFYISGHLRRGGFSATCYPSWF